MPLYTGAVQSQLLVLWVGMQYDRRNKQKYAV